jgi:valyl-tRNA synthetase
MQIAPREEIPATLSAGEHAALLDEQSGFVTSLGGVGVLTVAAKAERPPHSASAVVSGVDVFVPLEGLIDFETERARLRKSIKKTEKGLKGVSSKLANENFVKRARPEIVESERARQVDLQAQLERLKAALDALED